jgi:hypothetical protein
MSKQTPQEVIFGLCEQLIEEHELGNLRSIDDIVAYVLGWHTDELDPEHELLGVNIPARELIELLRKRAATQTRTMRKTQKRVPPKKRERKTEPQGNVIAFPERALAPASASTRVSDIDDAIVEGLGNEAIYQRVGGKKTKTLELIRERREALTRRSARTG